MYSISPTEGYRFYSHNIRFYTMADRFYTITSGFFARYIIYYHNPTLADRQFSHICQSQLPENFPE